MTPSTPDAYRGSQDAAALAQPATHVTKPAHPCNSVEDTPSEFSDQTFVLWVQMNDGSWAFAIVDPDPPAEAE